jgi:hypothetical protein
VTIQQLNMDLDNEPGRLFSVTDALGEAGVNIRALSVVDRDGVSTARMLVSDVKTAREVVLALDVPARIDDVIVVEMDDTPGSLAALLEPVFDEYVNIRHLEAFSEINGRAVAIVKFSDHEAAEAILRKSGQTPLSMEDIFPEPEGEE